ncbi:protein of unknown function [Candidatus Hydrogenisulfobacillus filiaventi]|uniref:Uncharacterized protein n=1 Tax=Candidatus Hydrogenisulfobacillus filiaventi TaxID=2707344 RepID=A0A6F8ZI81_9FIRM|nr:protein of unknown function [Candidatus Hydrogenisulfobacillus filiaventi]
MHGCADHDRAIWRNRMASPKRFQECHPTRTAISVRPTGRHPIRNFGNSRLARTQRLIMDGLPCPLPFIGSCRVSSRR